LTNSFYSSKIGKALGLIETKWFSQPFFDGFPDSFMPDNSLPKNFFKRSGQFFVGQFFALTILYRTILHSDNSSPDDSLLGQAFVQIFFKQNEQFFTRTVFRPENSSPGKFSSRADLRPDNSSSDNSSELFTVSPIKSLI
jgi:hypothetical protein